MSLTLRGWHADDADRLCEIYAEFPDLERQLSPITNRDQALDWIAHHRTERSWFFALVDGDQILGNVGLSGIEHRHDTGWFSYWMGPGRGRGVMSRAAATVATWALTTAPEPLFRLELGARVNNPASIRVAMAAGFVREGVERAKLAYDGQRYDVVAMARLTTDPVPTVEPVAMIAE